MQRLVKAVLVLLVTTAVGALAEMPGYDKMTLEIYAHSSVLMEQAPADIWPFVIDPNSRG